MKTLRLIIILILQLLILSSCKEDEPSIDCEPVWENFRRQATTAGSNTEAIFAIRDRFKANYPECGF